MELDRKAFHFDLDNESVERFYTGKKNPWSDIQDFLESHCFEKPQYSGYESAENIVMSYQRAYGTIDEMMDEFPWFQKCLKAATFTEIGKSYDVKEFLESGMQLSPSSRPDTRKELHFDLGTAALSENYSSIRPNAWRGAWTLIRIFMERNGFIHVFWLCSYSLIVELIVHPFNPSDRSRSARNAPCRIANHRPCIDVRASSLRKIPLPCRPRPDGTGLS